MEHRERPWWGRLWPLALPPPPPPGWAAVHARHALLDGGVPLARLQLQGRCRPRLRRDGDVPAPALEDQAEIGLGDDLQPAASWPKCRYGLLKRLTRRQCCDDSVAHG